MSKDQTTRTEAEAQALLDGHIAILAAANQRLADLVAVLTSQLAPPEGTTSATRRNPAAPATGPEPGDTDE